MPKKKAPGKPDEAPRTTTIHILRVYLRCGPWINVRYDDEASALAANAMIGSRLEQDPEHRRGVFIATRSVLTDGGVTDQPEIFIDYREVAACRRIKAQVLDDYEPDEAVDIDEE